MRQSIRTVCLYVTRMMSARGRPPLTDAQYAYDANRNMTTWNGSSVAWVSYNLPTTINGTSGGSSVAV